MKTKLNSKPLSGPVKPINLKKRFGQRYKIEYEPAYYAEYGPRARTDDPWLQVIPCHYGEIFPWGEDLLAASTFRRGSIANRLAGLNCCQIRQDGCDGVTVTFHIDDFHEVAQLIKPRSRRRLTLEARRALVKAGQSKRFKKQPG